MTKRQAPILIVGAGPAGLTLAVTLLNANVPFRIIDKRKEQTLLSRAINVSPGTLEILNALGCLNNNLLQQALQLEDLSVYFEGKRLFTIKGEQLSSTFPYVFHITQPLIEQSLIQKLLSANINIERGISLTELCETEQGATVTLMNDSGEESQECFQYVVGCDGGQSTVKKLLNINEEIETYDAYFLLADVVLQENISTKNLKYFLTEQGYIILAPLPNNKVRIIVSFKGKFPGLENINVDKYFLEQLIAERSFQKIHIQEITWITGAPFYQRLSSSAQSKSVFLAGDALHQFSPVGGTNMNIGIADAYDLGLRFASSYQEKTNHPYLLNYGHDRLSLARKNIDITRWATMLMTRLEGADKWDKVFCTHMKNRKIYQDFIPQLFSGALLKNSTNFNQTLENLC